MANLQQICNLPIEFNSLENEIRLSSPLKCRNKRKIAIDNIAHTLLNGTITYPRKVYEEYTVCLEDDIEIFSERANYDLMVIPSGLLGIEFVKSHTYYKPVQDIYSSMRFSTIVEGIVGAVSVLMQKNHGNFNIGGVKPSVQEGIIVELQPGDKIAIPEGYFYTFVNTTDDTVVFSRVYKVDEYSQPCSQIKATKGLAYFCIRKNAKLEFVYNPRFRNIPSIKQITPAQNHMPDLGFDLEESLYDLVKTRTEHLLALLG